MEQLFYFSKLERGKHRNPDVGLRNVELRIRDQHVAVSGRRGQPVFQRSTVHAGRADGRCCRGLPSQLRPGPPRLLQRFGPGGDLQHADRLPRQRGRHDERRVLPPPPALPNVPIADRARGGGVQPAARGFPLRATSFVPVPAERTAERQPDDRIFQLVRMSRAVVSFHGNISISNMRVSVVRTVLFRESFVFCALFLISLQKGLLQKI